MKKKIFFIACQLMSCSIFAQQGSLQGYIIGENHVPLAGISIQLEGTKFISATDNEGQFYFTIVPAGNYTVVATGIGYAAKSKTVSISSGKVTSINFQLDTKANVLQEVVVKGMQRLAIANTSSLTRTNTAVKDLPQSVQSISRTTINEQQLYRVDDAMKNVAGVNVASAYGSYNFRGFTTNSVSFLTNGMKGNLFPEGVANSLANIESIEVLRGPSAILYGENALGGNVNFVTKQPRKNQHINASLGAGSFNLVRAQADITGSLNKKKSLYYIAGLAAENGGSFTKHWKNRSLLLFSSLKWEINPKTSWQLNANYNHDNSTSNYSPDLPFIQGNVFSTPFDFNFMASDARFLGNSFQLQSHLHHKLNSNWGLHLLAGFARTDAKRTYYSIGDYVDPANDNKVERSKSVSRMQVPTTTVNAYATGAFKTGTVGHIITAGLDYNKENGTYPEGFKIYAADSISVTNPDRSPFIPAPGPLGADYYYSSYEKFLTETMGVYLQNQFSIGEKWKAVLGLRFNHYFNRYKADSVSYNNFETYEEKPEITTAFIPRLGIVFQPNRNISLYADYNSGFVPQYSNNRQSGGPFKPETSHQFEVGVKGEFARGKLVPTLAFYHINKNNVLTPDLNDPNGLLLKTLGQVRSKGMEATLTGNVTDNWTVIANYSYNESEITKSNEADEIGQRFANNPANMASLWSTYQFNQKLSGIKVGAGIRYIGNRFIRDIKTSDTNPVVLPEYTVADLLVQYSYKQFSFSANLNNVFDKKFIQGSFWSRSVFPGTQRNFLLTATYSFKK